MIIAFQIILLVCIIISFMGVVADNDKNTKGNLSAFGIASITAFVVSVLYL